MLPLFLRPRLSSSTLSSSTLSWESLRPPIIISRSAILNFEPREATSGNVRLITTSLIGSRTLTNHCSDCKCVATNPRHLCGPIQYGRHRRGSIRVFERSNKVLADYLPKKMAEGIADCMPLALRSVGDAIRHDSENRTKV